LRKRRKGEISSDEAKETQTTILGCIDTFYATDPLIRRANEISVEINHSPYDCLYLATAEAYRSILVTADREFYDRVAKSPYSHLIVWIEHPVKPN